MLNGKLVMLSNEITETNTLRSLAVVGLNMQCGTVDSHLNNEGNINDAAYEVLNSRTSLTIMTTTTPINSDITFYFFKMKDVMK